MANFTVELETRKREVVTAAAVATHLHDSEVAEALETDLSVNVCVNSPGRCVSLLAEFLLLLIELHVLLYMPSHVDSPVEHDPVDFVVAGLQLPVHHNVRGRITIPKRVAGRQQHTLLTDVNAHVAVGFVLSAAVGGDTADEIVNLAGADAAGEGLHLQHRVGVLPVASLALGSQEVQRTVLVHVVLVDEL